MKALVTISKRSNTKGDGRFHINIKDASSRLTVVEVSMSLSEFAEAIGGLGESDGEIVHAPTAYAVERLGKKKVVERVQMARSIIRGSTKDHAKAAVNTHFLVNYSGDGWEVWSDGTNSQQNGVDYEYIICKYVEIDEQEQSK